MRHVHVHSSSVNTEIKPASESQTESFYNYANQVTLKSHRSHSESHSASHSESHGESHNESYSESHSESQTESLGLGELTR